MRHLAAALVLLAAVPVGARGQERPDLIVVDALVHTMDPVNPRAEALAIARGEIVAVGDSASVASLGGPDTRIIDAERAVVLPGLIDAHGHVMNLGRFLGIVDLFGTRSAEEVAERVREAARTRAPGEWILGRGWDQNDWAVKEFPTRELLDRVAPANPVYLDRVDGHAVWVNSAALEAGEVTAATPEVAGGQVVRDAQGRPTGILVDFATDLVERKIPVPSEEELGEMLRAAQERIVSLGTTSVHEMGVGPDTLALYRRWDAAGRLVPRLVVWFGARSPAAIEWWRSEGAALHGEPGRRFRVRGPKIYADGALGSRGAALLEPYSDAPEMSGTFLVGPDSLVAIVTAAVELGLQPAIHAIGDAGNRAALDAIEAAGRPDLRPRIEHVQVVAPEDILRFAELGVLASFQPTHATSDMYWAEDRVGPERIRGAYAWRTFRDSGARLACGSDFPVESPNPFFGIYAAVTRQDQESWPEGGWRAEERMTREEALACFTRDAAWAAGMEDEVGSIAVGKRGDFVIVDADPLTAPAEDLWKIRVLRTVIDGETVYEAAPEGRGPERVRKVVTPPGGGDARSWPRARGCGGTR
ncbi:MAG TPA: amidohydrolase family protein [Gemmatimonadota bacterium]|nr:amidohydrolase family protein [Gemmatimonadota bacterium]